MGHHPGVTPRRGLRLAIAMALLAAIAGPATVVRAGVTSRILPDVQMLAPWEFRIQISGSGKKLLRFTTVAVNMGPGTFQLYGYDPINGQARIGETLNVRQQIKHTDGSFETVETNAKMNWASDGHEHWHLDGYQRFWIQNADGTPLRYLRKIGFCAFDSYYYGSASPAFYTWERYACRIRPDGRVPMGTSRLWGDVYRSTIAWQWIDITGLPNGEYRVMIIADPPYSTGGNFIESNELNNRSWAKIRITGTSVTVLSKSKNP
jgi:hypothetical protein